MFKLLFDYFKLYKTYFLTLFCYKTSEFEIITLSGPSYGVSEENCLITSSTTTLAGLLNSSISESVWVRVFSSSGGPKIFDFEIELSIA
jgi:hypothetical protein